MIVRNPLTDVMESNRRFRPAGTADTWPYVRRVFELVQFTLGDPKGGFDAQRPTRFETNPSPGVGRK
jgi:hypothetical protein